MTETTSVENSNNNEAKYIYKRFSIKKIIIIGVVFLIAAVSYYFVIYKENYIPSKQSGKKSGERKEVMNGKHNYEEDTDLDDQILTFMELQDKEMDELLDDKKKEEDEL